MSNIEIAKLQWREDAGLTSEAYGDVYFSVDDGAAESTYVFLQHNRLKERFSQLKDTPDCLFTIVETGFGTGLNFTLCLKLWLQFNFQHARLRFISIEKHPLTLADLQRAAQQWPQLQSVADQWLTSYPPIFPGLYTCPIDSRVELCLFFGDVSEALDELIESLHPLHKQRNGFIDAWFLDGFAPSKNPEMWSTKLFKRMAQLSCKGSTFATFTAAGLVRRGLSEVGFHVVKVPGFGRKREMLTGQFGTDPIESHSLHAKPPRHHNATWYLNEVNHNNQCIAVIGAGIAGAHIAHSLAKRGVVVDVFDASEGPAQHASGNPQGVVYGKLSHQDSAQARLIAHCLHFAQQGYRQLFEKGALTSGQDGDLCGVLHLEDPTNLQHLANTFTGSDHFLSCLDTQQASKAAGVGLNKGAALVHGGLWLNPVSLCQHLFNHPNIKCHYQQRITHIATSADGCVIADKRYDHVVLATGVEQQTISQFLPIKPIRGQVTYIKSAPPLNGLQRVICDLGYIAPAIHQQHCIGASFNLHESSLHLNMDDQQANIEHLTSAITSLDKDTISPSELTGRAAFRCTTPDYLPMVGPLCRPADFNAIFAPLGKDAKRDIYHHPPYHSAVSVFTGFGSKGLAYAPLCAEHLAAALCNERSPLPLSQHMLLHPSRFLVRNIIKNKM